MLSVEFYSVVRCARLAKASDVIAFRWEEEGKAPGGGRNWTGGSNLVGRNPPWKPPPNEKYLLEEF